MKQQTAMQEFIEWFKENKSTAMNHEVSKTATELLKKEEEQISQAWISGLNETPKGNAQNYFNQTYQINQ